MIHKSAEKEVTVYELLEYIYTNLFAEPRFTPAQLAMCCQYIVQDRDRRTANV